MSITPVFRAHVFMLRWFGELLDTKPLGLRDLQTALAKKMDTPEWRKAVADFLTANSNRLGQTTEAAHFVALVLATVCQLNEGSACTGDPVGYMVSVADLVEWAITKMDGQEVWKTQRVASTTDKPPKRRSKSAASPSPNKKSRQ
jgi:hypothetical protein